MTELALSTCVPGPGKHLEQSRLSINICSQSSSLNNEMALHEINVEIMPLTMLIKIHYAYTFVSPKR